MVRRSRVFASVRHEVQTLDPTLPLFDVKTLTRTHAAVAVPDQDRCDRAGSFGLVALIVGIGIYGITSYAVAHKHAGDRLFAWRCGAQSETC
jgi:hypothetical protein